jgi:hypothetical protein
MANGQYKPDDSFERRLAMKLLETLWPAVAVNFSQKTPVLLHVYTLQSQGPPTIVTG